MGTNSCSGVWSYAALLKRLLNSDHKINHSMTDLTYLLLLELKSDPTAVSLLIGCIFIFSAHLSDL